MTEDISDVTVTVDHQMLWEAVFGSNPFAFSWWTDIEWLDGCDWEHIGRVKLSVESPDDDEVIEKVLGIDDLVRAHGWLLNNPRYHCFGYRVGADLEDFDACEGDVYLQVAALGQDYYS